MNNLDVAIYLRKSRADVEEEQKAMDKGADYDALGKHRRELLSLARKGQHAVIDIFEEIVSGESISARPKMMELLKNIENEKYEGVLVMDIDRLGRGNKYDQGQIENAFRETGTLIITPTSIYDLTQEEGEFSVEVKTFLANMEYRSIRRRLERGLHHSARQGKDIGGNAPYGYTKDEELKLVIDPVKAETIRMIFDMCVSGVGVRFIRKRLFELGIESPTGNEYWGTTMIKRVISNKKYAGYMVYGKRQHKKQRDGRYSLKPKRDERKYIEVADAHEAIVPLETFEAAQLAMARRDPRVNTKRRLVYPLAGLLKCGKCGRTMRCQAPKNRANKYLYCGNDDCNQKGIILNEVEEVVLNELRGILERVKMTGDNVTAESLEAEKRQILKRIAQIEKEEEKNFEKKGKIYDFYESGTYTKEIFQERLNVVQDRQRKNEHLLAQLRKDAETVEERMDTQLALIPTIENVLDVYTMTDDPEHQNRILRTIVKEITYDRVVNNKRIYDPNEVSLKIHLVE